MGLFSTSPDPLLAARLTRLEAKIDAILAHLNIDLPNNGPDDGLNEVRTLAAAGQKIEAIKRYRDLTGAGLAEAKAAVEAGL